VARDGALYFGPYASAGAVRETLKEIYRIFPLRHYPLERCRRRSRPCLFHQIGQCSAPCHGLISRVAYRQLVDGVIALLSGKGSEVCQQLKKRMEQASAAMNFEEAARLRDQVRAIEQTVERQKVVAAAHDDQDVFGLHRQEGSVVISVLFVRHGKLIGRRTYPLEWRLDEPELLASFLQEFYSRDVAIPRELLLPLLPEDPETLGEWLEDRAGRRVALNVPQRGDKKLLLEMANRNAKETFQELDRQQAGRERLLEELRDRLHLVRTPRRIECFDISNIQGAQSVGSMSVMCDGELARQEYRHYRIRSVSGADDYASLAEVLSRRLQRGIDEQTLPDCILIDGGPGQLKILSDILRRLQLDQRIDAVGIAKSRVFRNARGKAVERSEERFFRPERKNPVILRQGSAALFLLENLRNEAHRFAITHHRKLRGKAALHSILEEIPGVGPGRRKLLLKHFGSLKKLRAASIDDLRSVPGLPAPLAETVYQHLNSG